MPVAALGASGGAVEPASGPAEKTAGQRLTYLPGVDGLRALAVLAVLLYHCRAAVDPGGFLGVDVFFVISGYLITSLLLASAATRAASISSAFWLRRARRLLPAVFLLIACDAGRRGRSPAPSESRPCAATRSRRSPTSTNWYLILSDQSYFEVMGRPSLFRHLWSLAVEEQFYIFWPLLLSAMLWLWRPRYVLLGPRWSDGLHGAHGAAVLSRTPTRHGSTTAQTPGASGSWPAPPSPSCGPREDWGAGASPSTAGGRGRAQRPRRALLHLPAADGHQPFLYQGGFALVAVAPAVLIAAVVHPRGHLGSDPGPAASPLARSAIVRRLPLALARLHAHAAPSRRPLRRAAAARPAVRSDSHHRRAVVPPRRDADSRRCAGTRLDGAPRGPRGPALGACVASGPQPPAPPWWPSRWSACLWWAPSVRAHPHTSRWRRSTSWCPRLNPADAVTTPGPTPTVTATARPKISTLALMPPARTSPVGRHGRAPTPAPVAEPAADPPAQPTGTPPAATPEPVPTLPATPAPRFTTEPAPTTTVTPPPTTPSDGAPAQGIPGAAIGVHSRGLSGTAYPHAGAAGAQQRPTLCLQSGSPPSAIQ